MELLEESRLRRIRQTLSEYARYVEIPGAPVNDADECDEFYPDNVSPAEHHDLMLGVLQDVAEGRIPRLMLLMPPGSAKSTYASVVFPTWVMGYFNNTNIIAATYGSDLAKKFGRKCRQIVRSDKFKELYGTTLTGDNAAVDDWSLLNRSTYMCGGILSGITGNRADGLIIDDPFKNREEADSEVIRKKTIEEYRSSLKTRLKPKAWEIIINTRWHMGDLSGEILPEGYAGESGWVKARDGEVWYVLCLQAQCERDDDPLGRKKGEYLWTEWFPIEWWEQTKRTQSIPDSRNWNSLFQQRPAAEEGDFFKREWMRWYETKPEHLRIYGASDYAVTANGGDYTVHMVAGVDPDDNIFILDVWRAQTDSMVWVEQFISMVKQYKPLEWAEGSDQISKGVGPLIDKRQQEEKAWCYRRQFVMPRGGDSSSKAVGAQSIRGRMAAGKVYFPKNAPWVTDFINELMVFDAGRNDDQVDAFALIGRMLGEMVAAHRPKEQEQPKWPLQMTIAEMIKDNSRRRNQEYD